MLIYYYYYYIPATSPSASNTYVPSPVPSLAGSQSQYSVSGSPSKDYDVAFSPESTSRDSLTTEGCGLSIEEQFDIIKEFIHEDSAKHEQNVTTTHDTAPTAAPHITQTVQQHKLPPATMSQPPTKMVSRSLDKEKVKQKKRKGVSAGLRISEIIGN